MKKGFRIIKFKKDKPIYQLKDISKSFDGRPILKKISIEAIEQSNSLSLPEISEVQTLKNVLEFNKFDLYSKEDDILIDKHVKSYYEDILNEYFFGELSW